METVFTARDSSRDQYTDAAALPPISRRYLCVIAEAKLRPFVLITQAPTEPLHSNAEAKRYEEREVRQRG